MSIGVKGTSPQLGRILALAAFLIAMPIATQPSFSQVSHDDTARNKDQGKPTADQQKNNASDLAITQKIRKAIHDDKDLSTYAHHIKIIAQNGKVTLRGPHGGP